MAHAIISQIALEFMCLPIPISAVVIHVVRHSHWLYRSHTELWSHQCIPVVAVSRRVHFLCYHVPVLCKKMEREGKSYSPVPVNPWWVFWTVMHFFSYSFTYTADFFFAQVSWFHYFQWLSHSPRKIEALSCTGFHHIPVFQSIIGFPTP